MAQLSTVNLDMLSNEALKGIIQILLKEVEYSRRPKGNFAKEQKSRKALGSQLKRKAETPQSEKECQNKQFTKIGSSSEDQSAKLDFKQVDLKTEDAKPTVDAAPSKEVKRKYVPKKTKDNSVNWITQESSAKENSLENCTYCKGKHKFGKKFCKAYGRTCHICKKPNHFAKACRDRKSLALSQGDKSKASEESSKSIQDDVGVNSMEWSTDAQCEIVGKSQSPTPMHDEMIKLISNTSAVDCNKLRSRFKNIKVEWNRYSKSRELEGKSLKQKKLFFLKFLDDESQDFIAGSFFNENQDVDDLLSHVENALSAQGKDEDD